MLRVLFYVCTHPNLSVTLADSLTTTDSTCHTENINKVQNILFSTEAVLDIRNMEDFSKIGLLDFQSRGGQHTSFPSQAHNTGLRLTTDFSTYQVGQTSNFSQKEVASGRGHQAASSTWNLEELMTDLALVYVSGDGERLEGDKLQFCTVRRPL